MFCPGFCAGSANGQAGRNEGGVVGRTPQVEGVLHRQGKQHRTAAEPLVGIAFFIGAEHPLLLRIHQHETNGEVGVG